MAYVPQQIPQDEENQFANPNQTTPNPLPPQGGGSAGASASGGRAAPGVGSSTQFGSNAAKLSDYLSANQSQVADFGNQVAGNLSQGYNTARSGIDQGFNDFNTKVNQGYTPNDPSLASQVSGNAADFVKDPKNVSKFQSLYNDQYAGPPDFESSDIYSGVNNQVNKAVENAGLTKSQSGLGSYLNNFMGTGGDTPGMQTLNTALLQRSPEASASIRNAAAPYSGLTDYLKQKTSAADANIGTAKTNAQQIAQGVQNQFNGPGGVIPTFKSNVADQMQQNQQKYQRSQTPDDLLSDYMGTLFPGNYFAPIPGTTAPSDVQTNMIDKGTLDNAKALKSLGFDVGQVQDPRDYFRPTTPAPLNTNMGPGFAPKPPEDPEEMWWKNQQ